MKIEYSLEYYVDAGLLGGMWRGTYSNYVNELKSFIIEKGYKNYKLTKLVLIKTFEDKAYVKDYKHLLDYECDNFVVKHLENENTRPSYTTKNYDDLKRYLYKLTRQDYKDVELWCSYDVDLS